MVNIAAKSSGHILTGTSQAFENGSLPIRLDLSGSFSNIAVAVESLVASKKT